MRYAPLGSTGLEVSSIGYGSAPLGGVFGEVKDLAAARATVHRAIDSGVTLFDTSPFYGNGLAERRLGEFLAGRRDDVLVSTKVGEYADGMDFRPERIRSSLHESLARLQTDHVDIFMMHDIEYVELTPLFEDSYAEMLALKQEGLCRAIGVTAYPIRTITRALDEIDIDVVLNYAHATLLNDELTTSVVPRAARAGVGVLNASSVHLGLLTENGPKLAQLPEVPGVREAASEVRRLCGERGVDVAWLAQQFSIQRSGAASTLIGTTNPGNLAKAVEAAAAPIDEDLLARVLAATAGVRGASWESGLPQNN